jgi:hypothetical protein
MAQGFTYCWSDSATAKVYVGVHKGFPEDGYICSSKTMLSEFKKRPSDFSRQILFVGNYEDCAKFEVSIIRALFKTDRNTYYNRSAGKKILFDDSIKKKISDKAKKRKLSIETIQKIQLAKQGQTSPRKGVSLSEETRKKISDAKKGCSGPNSGRKFSAEIKIKMSNGQKSRAPFPEEHRQKLSIAAKKNWQKRKAGE